MKLSIESIEILLLVAGFVAMLARRIRVPYTVALVAAGLAVAVVGVGGGMALSKELIFTAFLPPLIFEAAIQAELELGRRSSRQGIVSAGGNAARLAHRRTYYGLCVL
ncbi:MAG: cation:proton antiporter [Fimbriimonadaceae bacterium]|nr:cation:proton antiporter [Fimbriimonadaceae bacterium]